MQKIDPIAVDLLNKKITLPHLGLTTRTILAVASEVAWAKVAELTDEERVRKANWRPRFKLVYKKVIIGEIYLKSLAQYLAGSAETLGDE